MKVRRTSMFSGKVHEADLPVTQEQLDARANGADIATAFPHLPPEWREFLMTGVTPDEWAKEFGKPRSAKWDGPEIGPVPIVEIPMDTESQRERQLRWCKDRALEYVNTGELQYAVTSMSSDIQKNELTRMNGTTLAGLTLVGGLMAADGDRQGVVRWIEGFR